MRLHLSSYDIGSSPERLVALVGDRREGVVVQNALDFSDDQQRRSDDLARQTAALGLLGLSAAPLDLRDHTPDTIGAALDGAGFVWVRGGNVFVLRLAMARSGFDRLIIDLLARDALVYAGFSAGPCVLAPSLRGLELCDPTADARRLHGEVRFDGLGVLDRPFVPHLDSPDHGESELLGEVAARYAAAGQPYHALRDGDVLVIDGDPTDPDDWWWNPGALGAK